MGQAAPDRVSDHQRAGQHRRGHGDREPHGRMDARMVAKSIPKQPNERHHELLPRITAKEVIAIDRASF
jgi:hypothetical protein